MHALITPHHTACHTSHLRKTQDHRSCASHACTAAPAAPQPLVIVCPLCAASVGLKAGEDPNAAYERHARAGGCDPHNYARVHQKPRCPVKGCKEKLTTINTYSCKACRQAVCMKHRHNDDHQCLGRPAHGIGIGVSAKRQATAVGAAASAAAASVGAQARGLVGRIGRAAAGGAAATGAAAPAAPVAGRSAPARSAAAGVNSSDPSNSVFGTAERRRQMLEQQQQQQQQQQGGGSGGWLSSLFTSAAPSPSAAAAASQGGAPIGARYPYQQQQQQQQQGAVDVIDLTDDTPTPPPSARPTSRAGPAPPAAPAGAANADFACHRCGAGFSDPVALVEHDAACASGGAGGGGGAGLAGRAANCRVS